MSTSDKSCSNCKYADYYPMHYMFPFYDPYCSKGHGECGIDKVCIDYCRIDLVNMFPCGKCTHYNGICKIRNKSFESTTVISDCEYFISIELGDYRMNEFKRYILKNGLVYDSEKGDYMNPNEIVKLLNKFEKSEWDKFVNSGW